MLTKKDKVLVQPWLEQRYAAHRQKVRDASAAVDVRTPAAQPHVAVKLKKTQRELERQREIVRENGRLLQRLGQIMNTSRVDNWWRECRPTFLRREPIGGDCRPKTAAAVLRRQRSASVGPSSSSAKTHSTDAPSSSVRGQSARCPTCCGRPTQRKQQIPEARVPWEPPRRSWNVKLDQIDASRMPQCCIYCC